MVVLLGACSVGPDGKVIIVQVPQVPPPATPSLSTNVEIDDRGIVAEINFMRRDPAAYAQQLLRVAEAFQPGDACPPGREACVLTLPDENQHTIQNVRAYRASIIEAAGVLRRQPPLPPLDVSGALKASALAHMRELSRGESRASHLGADGSSPRDRMARYGDVQGKIAENIILGFSTAFGVVASWLIDHGVVDRNHRENLLDPDLRYVGAACGQHPTYRVVCVTDFAAAARP